MKDSQKIHSVRHFFFFFFFLRHFRVGLYTGGISRRTTKLARRNVRVISFTFRERAISPIGYSLLYSLRCTLYTFLLKPQFESEVVEIWEGVGLFVLRSHTTRGEVTGRRSFRTYVRVISTSDFSKFRANQERLVG